MGAGCWGAYSEAHRQKCDVVGAVSSGAVADLPVSWDKTVRFSKDPLRE